MKTRLRFILLPSSFFLLFGCTTLTPNQQAIATTATNIARIAASAAATYYGGPAAGELASAGLDALGQVVQSYVGHPIPSDIVTASPGVAGVGPALVSIISPDHKVTQADADKIAQAAKIADAIKVAVVTPVKPVSSP